MVEFFQLILSGLTVGFIYALVGMGFTVIYNSSGIINFSQGEFVMAGGMSADFIKGGSALWSGILLSILITSVLGIWFGKLVGFI